MESRNYTAQCSTSSCGSWICVEPFRAVNPKSPCPRLSLRYKCQRIVQCKPVWPLWPFLRKECLVTPPCPCVNAITKRLRDPKPHRKHKTILRLLPPTDSKLLTVNLGCNSGSHRRYCQWVGNIILALGTVTPSTPNTSGACTSPTHRNITFRVYSCGSIFF